MRLITPRSRSARRLGTAAAAVAALTAISLAAPAVASDPSETTISDPGSKTVVSRQFSGTILGTGRLYAVLPCTALYCDSHELHLDLPANFWKTHTGRVTVTVAWEDSSADLDLFVNDAEGRRIASVETAGEGPEIVDLGKLAPGDYTIQVSSWIALPETDYTGTIKLAAKRLTKKKRR